MMTLKGEYQPYPSLLKTLTYVAMLKHAITANYKHMSNKQRRAVLSEVQLLLKTVNGVEQDE